MATYVYRRASSTGARELADAIAGRRFRGRLRPIAQQAQRGDVVVCWGEALSDIPGVRILNGAPIRNKYQDALDLKAAGIATIEAHRQKPAAQAGVDDAVIKPFWEEAVEAAEDFIEIPFVRNPLFIQSIKDFHVLITKLEQQLSAPAAAAVQTVWLPRSFTHVGGTDLLQPPAQPDFYVKKETIVEEVRIHSFNGKSIRAGIKKPRAGVQPHAWIRSYDGGWTISYDGFESKKVHRELAHAAVKALNLQFGAVDLGKKVDGTWIVLEVNRACGLEGGTTESYARAIQQWIQQNP